MAIAVSIIMISKCICRVATNSILNTDHEHYKKYAINV